jgi:cell division protein FtsB
MSSTTAPAGDHSTRRVLVLAGRGMRRVSFHLALTGVIVVVAMLVGVLPVATWIRQSDEIARSESVLANVRRSTAELKTRIAALRTDDEVSRIAREQLGMVPEGREAYAITNLRPGENAISEPPRVDTDPLDGARAEPAPRQSAWRELLDAATFWD